MVEDLADDFKEAIMMTRRKRMRLEVVVKKWRENNSNCLHDQNNIDQRGRGKGKGSKRGGFGGKCFHYEEEGHRAFECS